MVADAVRKLAERTTTSVQKITSMVQLLHERSRNMTSAMGNTVTPMRQGVSMAQDVGAP